MAEALTLRLMTEAEAARLVELGRDEGWNPGLHDARIFWETDPEAFIAAELDDELIGGGTIVSYDGAFGFMGLFIVRPEFRGRGLGSQLWHARVRLLQSRLQAGAAIGMDGVFEMQDWYAAGRLPLRPSLHPLRGHRRGRGARLRGWCPRSEVPFERLAAYDRRCFPAPRERFLRAWLEQPEEPGPGSVSMADRCTASESIRRCGTGGKIGPLFADDADVAEELYTALAAYLPGEPVYLDVPEINAWAMGLARRHRMHEVFGTARMYLGPRPDFAESRVYGITTFELG